MLHGLVMHRSGLSSPVGTVQEVQSLVRWTEAMADCAIPAVFQAAA